MKQVIDCVLVGFKEYDINMRVLAAQQNDAAYINARFQYINYKNRKIYYDQFLSSFLYDDRMQSAGSNRRFCGAKRTRCGASGLNLYLLKSADTL